MLRDAEQESGRAARQRFWQGEVQLWQQSGETQRAFCRQRELSSKSFNYWKRKLADSGQRPALALVEVGRLGVRTAATVAPMRIEVAEGRYRVEVTEGFDPATLMRLLEVLERER